MHRGFVATLSLLLFLPFAASAASPRAGQPGASPGYIELPRAIETESEGNKVEVREFFWYGCSHCYSLEPLVERWRKQKPANIEFVRTPAAVGNWALHARAYYAFESLGALERLHWPFFQAIHQQNRRMNDEAAIAKFVAEHGVDPAKFREAFNSFGVRLKLEKARRLYEAAKLDSVPNFLVAGKYVTSPALTGDPAAMFNVVEALAKQAGGGQAKRSTRAK